MSCFKSKTKKITTDTPQYLFVHMLDTLDYSFSSPLMLIRLYPHLLLINKSFQNVLQIWQCRTKKISDGEMEALIASLNDHSHYSTQ